MIPRIKEGLRINDEGMVFDPSSGESFTLNPTGLVILRMMVGGAGEEEIFKALSGDYNLTREEFDRHLIDFLSVLKSCQLLDNDA
jgi:PqqD family protein of HPr-rel-A system